MRTPKRSAASTWLTAASVRPLAEAAFKVRSAAAQCTDGGRHRLAPAQALLDAGSTQAHRQVPARLPIRHQRLGRPERTVQRSEVVHDDGRRRRPVGQVHRRRPEAQLLLRADVLDMHVGKRLGLLTAGSNP